MDTINLNMSSVESPSADSVVNNIQDILFGNDNNVTIGTETPSNTRQRGGFFWGKSESDNDRKALIAAKTKRFDVLDFMVNNDMINNYNCQDEDGCTLLHHISRNYELNSNAPKMVKKILSSSGISSFINTKNNQGDTALVAAVKSNHGDLADMLVGAGADKSIRNNEGLFVGTDNDDTSQSLKNNNLLDLLNTLGTNNHQSMTDTDENDAPVTLTGLTAMSDHYGGHKGGEDSVIQLQFSDSVSDISVQNTDNFLQQLVDSYVVDQTGGVRNVRISQRPMNTYSGNFTSVEETEEAELNRLFKSQSTEIHERVIKKIMELMGVEEDVAKDYKAAIYREVKLSQPELGSIDRALAMEKLATKKHLEPINIEAVRKEIKTHLENRAKEKENNPEKSKKKTSKEQKISKESKKVTKKTDAKKTKKKSKKDDSTTSEVNVTDAGLSETSPESLMFSATSAN